MDINLKTILDKIIQENQIVLFMKGTANQPMCGFSFKVANILNEHNVKFQDINVLESNELREGIKEYSNWPTIPQLYVNGEFLGGCDIVTEMEESGELEALLKNCEKVSE
jgi:monothiol glutaredoxin